MGREKLIGAHSKGREGVVTFDRQIGQKWLPRMLFYAELFHFPVQWPKGKLEELGDTALALSP